jgi:hypothetical protein
MDNLQKYINHFFDELEVFEDLERGHSYKAFLRQAINHFLETESKESAFAVYDAFFGSYRITLASDNNRFIDLLDVLRTYEENAASLIDYHRDHYIHSVNVFIIGLCIYIQNARFREAFDEVNIKKSGYENYYSTKHEEFFYRWGIAALFHDVGYPIEITGKQIRKFLTFISDVDGGTILKSHIKLENFPEFNIVEEIDPQFKRIGLCQVKNIDLSKFDLLRPTDLLAHKLQSSLGVDLIDAKQHLDGFVVNMEKYGFIDHGFYSAVIVLKWYGFLIQCCRYKPEYFFYPVLDSASAILLHNYYKNVLMKEPFNRGPLSVSQHPIAFLLMLCDELQEWDRQGYGLLERKQARAGDLSIFVSDERFELTYITEVGKLPKGFADKKEELLGSILNMSSLFIDGYSIGCESIEDLSALVSHIREEKTVTPRPLLENLEKLAIAIHNKYNQRQLERYPDEALEYPNFSDLPDSLKYSNLRQAQGIITKLDYMGWEMRPKDGQGVVIREIAADVLEQLAEFEHEEWIKERLYSGWKYGKSKDIERKITPYLIPYEDLDEDIKEKDRDVIRNIPELLDQLDMAVFVK